jgi:hypothetical protein
MWDQIKTTWELCQGGVFLEINCDIKKNCKKLAKFVEFTLEFPKLFGWKKWLFS